LNMKRLKKIFFEFTEKTTHFLGLLAISMRTAR
jgi:hypothetical protein